MSDNGVFGPSDFRTFDRESDVLRAVVEALSSLDDDERARVVSYINQRFKFIAQRQSKSHNTRTKNGTRLARLIVQELSDGPKTMKELQSRLPHYSPSYLQVELSRAAIDGRIVSERNPHGGNIKIYRVAESVTP